MRRVLLTGAGGFVGRHAVAPLLARGYEVHAAVRRPGAVPPEVVQHAVDLLDPASSTALVRAVRPSHLLHLAWTVTPGAFWRAPDNLDWVAASLGLYRAFAEAGGRRMVVAGTCAEYDWSHPLLDEAVTPLRPDTLYGAAKDALHRVLAAAAVQDGVGLAWGRLFFLYGPHEAASRLVPDVVLSLLQGRPALCGTGTAERDFMHVADAASALAALLDSLHAGPVNIASGACVPIRDVILHAAAAVGRPDLVLLGARPASPGEPPRLAAATSILREQVGFTPRYALDDGLADTVAWWRSQPGALR